MGTPQTKLDFRYRKERVLRFVEDPNGLGLEMMLVSGGEFWMGSPEEEPGRSMGEGPQHEVQVRAFLLGRYPVTQSQWRFVVERVPQIAVKLDSNPSGFEGKDRPVEKVKWYEAIEFCARLSQLMGVVYRLPSEAEWEYACRAGTTTPFHFGKTISSDVANYDATKVYGQGEVGKRQGETTSVGYFDAANNFGLSDMHGNVWEWCADPWHKNYQGAPGSGHVWDGKLDSGVYEIIESSLSELLADNRKRVTRGGSWFTPPRYCRSAFRTRIVPDFGFDYQGFRVARSAPRT
ncbi:hypothetical protein KR51_00019290 [Rubidibacter lacunae KORDI 51-2]|uniref:Sulfatase-modifying factor enzyme-like domain-containing protein n=1 Tax=Rubidibacter lacunae KORDI 51-2 TaxID=582515 RepID=U5DKB8_9CHRO|nr:formylglycine-generating enzyme family protein [Rubidibacter lacunae]ERN41362.1 hypothetical protein KR51_00019290 [Rubidibacter lacunae KORDI 51-2]